MPTLSIQLNGLIFSKKLSDSPTAPTSILNKRRPTGTEVLRIKPSLLVQDATERKKLINAIITLKTKVTPTKLLYATTSKSENCDKK